MLGYTSHIFVEYYPHLTKAISTRLSSEYGWSKVNAINKDLYEQLDEFELIL